MSLPSGMVIALKDPARMLTIFELGAARRALRLWIDNVPVKGPAIDDLRHDVKLLYTTKVTREWIARATALGLDPL